jgi:hypothetical protein
VDRRRFLVGAVGAGTATVVSPWVGSAAAASDDELVYANFGASVELLVKDFYTRALDADVFPRTAAGVLRKGRTAAAQHAKALSELLVGAGDVGPTEEDFAFEWPARTFRTAQASVTTGSRVLRALLGAYLSAGANVTEASYRVLYSSLAASVGQQLGALTSLSRPTAVEPFPVALDLESATTALERYLG